MQSAATVPERRWSHHGWNNRLSLYLIRTIMPRLPRPLAAMALFVTTMLCYVAMGHERNASMVNLRRICPERGFRLRRRSFSLFYNFGRFMVARMELNGLSETRLTKKVINYDNARAVLARVLDEGRGAVVATAHLGNWEMGIRLLTLSGRPVHVVMMEDGDRSIEGVYEKLRVIDGVRVHWINKNPFVGVELLSALRNGGIVAVQADRNAGASQARLPMFGAPVSLPLGPASLARAAGVPIIPCFVVMESGNSVKLRIDPPIMVTRTSDPARDLIQATSQIARCIEGAVAEYPDQWFNFYPIWEQERSS